MESQSVFQAETQTKFCSIESPPWWVRLPRLLLGLGFRVRFWSGLKCRRRVLLPEPSSESDRRELEPSNTQDGKQMGHLRRRWHLYACSLQHICQSCPDLPTLFPRYFHILEEQVKISKMSSQIRERISKLVYFVLIEYLSCLMFHVRCL